VGQFTVPGYITRMLRKTGVMNIPGGTNGTGTLAIHTCVANRFQIPDFDLGLLTFEVTNGRSLMYQYSVARKESNHEDIPQATSDLSLHAARIRTGGRHRL
jgi:hypothetical protein